MPYCPKCGNEVNEAMTFCPRCGAALKAEAQSKAPFTSSAPTYQRRDEKSEKNEKNEQNEKNEKQEKGEHGYVGWFIGGLVLIIIGLLSMPIIRNSLTGANGAIFLVLIGIIIIVAAFYLTNTAKRRHPRT